MANPSGNHQEPSHASSSFNGGNPVNGNSAPVSAPESSGAAMAMKHNPGIAMDWTPEEQTIIEEGLAKWVYQYGVFYSNYLNFLVCFGYLGFCFFWNFRLSLILSCNFFYERIFVLIWSIKIWCFAFDCDKLPIKF